MLSSLDNRRLPRSPSDHAAVLHPAGIGRVTLATRTDGGAWRERSVPVRDLPYAVRHLAGAPDVYLSQTRFFGPRRLVTRLAELDALFTDLDYHTTEHAGAHPLHVLDLALDALARALLPHPSFAVATGRGLALVWLHHGVPRAALPRWRACQLALCDSLRQLGADRLATDAARVLRLVGTVNRRSGSLVEAILPVGEVWNFDALADAVLPLERAELVALRLERVKRRAAAASPVPPGRYFTAAGLWELRLSELQRLREHRWFGPLPAGHCDVWLLLAATAVSYLVPAPMVRREIAALAREAIGGRWHEPEAVSRMSSIIGRAEQAARGEKVFYAGRLDPRYRFRTATIVELLGITEAEMRACGFCHLVSPEIARELERVRWHERRAAAASPSRVEYLGRSLSRLRPWEAEGVSRATWYRRRETSASGCMVAKP